MPNAKELYIQVRVDAGITDNARNQSAWQDIVDNHPAELNVWLAKATQTGKSQPFFLFSFNSLYSCCGPQALACVAVANS